MRASHIARRLLLQSAHLYQGSSLRYWPAQAHSEKTPRDDAGCQEEDRQRRVAYERKGGSSREEAGRTGGGPSRDEEGETDTNELRLKSAQVCCYVGCKKHQKNNTSTRRIPAQGRRKVSQRWLLKVCQTLNFLTNQTEERFQPGNEPLEKCRQTVAA